MILAGDIGGTKTRLGLFRQTPDGLVCLRAETFANDQHPDVAAVLQRFVAGETKIAAAGLGVAGPVAANRAQLTNRDWSVDGPAIAQQLGIGRVAVVNDLVAIALGVVHLPESGFAVLNAGSLPWAAGNLAVVAPGTGFGQAATLWTGGRHLPIATEAGHADFPALNERQSALRAFLARRHGDSDGHVSLERILSGAGLAELYDFAVAAAGAVASPPLAQATPERKPALVSELANNGDPLCVEAVELFCDVLAAEAGNAALRYWALGGVALAGGIAPHLMAWLSRPQFLERFAAKGRFAGRLRALPLRVVIDADVAILGAAHAALDAGG